MWPAFGEMGYVHDSVARRPKRYIDSECRTVLRAVHSTISVIEIPALAFFSHRCHVEANLPRPDHSKRTFRAPSVVQRILGQCEANPRQRKAILSGAARADRWTATRSAPSDADNSTRSQTVAPQSCEVIWSSAKPRKTLTVRCNAERASSPAEDRTKAKPVRLTRAELDGAIRSHAINFL